MIIIKGYEKAKVKHQLNTPSVFRSLQKSKYKISFISQNFPQLCLPVSTLLPPQQLRIKLVSVTPLASYSTLGHISLCGNTWSMNAAQGLLRLYQINTDST